MRRAWSRKAKGCRLTNAFEAFSCEENEAPLCFSHSLPRLVSPLQMGGLSLTRRLFNAWSCDCSTEERTVWTRDSFCERRACKINTWVALASADRPGCSVKTNTL